MADKWKNLLKKKSFWVIGISAILVAALLVVMLCVLPKVREEKERQRWVAQYRQDKITKFQAENAQYEDYEVEVAFIGDSLTDGYPLEKFYPQYVTANRGIGGDTTFLVEERLQVSVYDLKPQVLVMLIGGNNLDTMFDNYEKLLQGYQENLPETQVVLLSLTAMGGEYAKKNPLAEKNNLKIQELAQKYGYYYVDIYSALYDPATGECKAEYLADEVHLNETGQQVITQVITPVLKQILQK